MYQHSSIKEFVSILTQNQFQIVQFSPQTHNTLRSSPLPWVEQGTFHSPSTTEMPRTARFGKTFGLSIRPTITLAGIHAHINASQASSQNAGKSTSYLSATRQYTFNCRARPGDNLASSHAAVGNKTVVSGVSYLHTIYTRPHSWTHGAVEQLITCSARGT